MCRKLLATEQGGHFTEQAEHHDHAHAAVQLGTLARQEHQRRQTEYGCERRHRDRPQRRAGSWS